MHLPFNFDYFYKGTKSVDDFLRAIREDEQKMKSAINEGLLYIETATKLAKYRREWWKLKASKRC